MSLSKTFPFFILFLKILYANEGESKKEPEFPVDPLPIGEKSTYICHKGHEFIPTLYHFPTNCEACTKPLWNMFKPPPALECRRCHIKCHKDHMDKKEEIIAPCKGRTLLSTSNYEPTQTVCVSSLWLFIQHKWTMTCRRPRTCCCWLRLKRSSRTGWAGWWKRFPRNLHQLSTLPAPRHAPPWRFSPTSPWGGPVDSSPPARAGKSRRHESTSRRFIFLCLCMIIHVPQQ